MSINSWRDWDSAITIPANFDGWMILPIQLFKTGESVDPTDVKQIVFSTSIFKNYDAFTSLTFGDLQIIEKDNKVSSYIDSIYTGIIHCFIAISISIKNLHS